jgi:hypothetical protein
MPATALVAALTLLVPACGGTLEGKYNRGQLTTTTSGPQGSVPTAPGSTTTTISTPPTSGNAAGPGRRGEPEGAGASGTIVGSAARRVVDSPPGGRHR